MKKNRILSLFSAAALLLAGACSNDTLDQGKNHGTLNTDDSGGVYLTVDFKMPSAKDVTRSETTPDGGSTGGTEVGSETENYVTTALIVLAATEQKGDIDEYGFIVAGEVQSNRIDLLTDATSKQFRATARLQKANLNSFYEIYPDGTVPSVYVFVFCNPTKELSNMFAGGDTPFGSADWIKSVCTVTQGTGGAANENVGIWGSNSFLMNNVNLTQRDLPKKLLDWEHFTSVDRPFHLSDKNEVQGIESVDNLTNRGSVLVERSVARFDFKDGSVNKAGNGTNDNKYNVLYPTNADGNTDDKNPIVQVQIQKMCLVNMCNQFYYVPRVSPNGQLINYELCGAEKPWLRSGNGTYSGGNFVVGPYATQFGGTTIMNGFSNYMNFPFFEDNGSFNNEEMSSTRWDVVKVEDVLKNGQNDNYASADGSVTMGSYKVWRYVTENVIPGNSGSGTQITTNRQMNGVSTGVVFKAKLLGTDEAMGDGLYEEYWNKGYIKNLANCLNGKSYTYEGTTHNGLTGSSEDDPIIYYFSGRLYMGWRHIRQAAIQASVSVNTAGQIEINRSTSLYKAVFGDGPIPWETTRLKDGSTTEYVEYVYYPEANGVIGTPIPIHDPNWNNTLFKNDGTTDMNSLNAEEKAAYTAYKESANYAWSMWAGGDKEVGDDATGDQSKDLPLLIAMREAVTGAGITIYQSSVDEDYGNGYYCYYYYWNRHNDNGINGTMGPMEFAVVRNNVYKLSIEKIARLGHPRIPENDPNNPTPDTPDESDEIYLDVRLQIAPWVVRLNKIQF